MKKPIFLPIITALLGSFVGPIAAMFPFSLFPPAAVAAVIIGSVHGAIGGFLLGLFFLHISKTHHWEELLNIRQWKRVLLIMMIGVGCAVIELIIFVILFNEKFPDKLETALFFAYAGAVTALVLWSIIIKDNLTKQS
jgi:hypothetical protein